MVRLPNRRDFGVSWTVKAKERAARLGTSCQDPFGHLKRTGFQMVTIAKYLIDKVSKIFQFFQVVKFGRHGMQGLLH